MESIKKLLKKYIEERIEAITKEKEQIERQQIVLKGTTYLKDRIEACEILLVNYRDLLEKVL